MKFFHLSDLHIGKQLHFYSLREDQEVILAEVVRYAKEMEPQAIVIAGDVYDKSVPSAEAVAVFDGFVRKISELGIEILVISGNHDSPERLDFASSLLEKQHLHMAGLVPACPEEHLKRVVLKDSFGEVYFWLLPFMKPGYVKNVFPEEEPATYTEAVKRILNREKMPEDARHVLVTHQFFTAAGKEPQRSDSEAVFVGGTGNVDISAVENFDYVAMGHIHKSQSVLKPQYRYCGTLLKYSAGESNDKKTLTVVTLNDKGTAPMIETLPLHPLRDVKQISGTLEDVLKMGCSDYVSITLKDKKMPYQPREQLDRVFPNLLGLKVENTGSTRFLLELPQTELNGDPLELFERFYQDIHGQEMSEEERKLVSGIIGEAQEELL